jgi:hypothetical protein
MFLSNDSSEKVLINHLNLILLIFFSFLYNIYFMWPENNNTIIKIRSFQFIIELKSHSLNSFNLSQLTNRTIYENILRVLCSETEFEVLY